MYSLAMKKVKRNKCMWKKPTAFIIALTNLFSNTRHMDYVNLLLTINAFYHCIFNYISSTVIVSISHIPISNQIILAKKLYGSCIMACNFNLRNDGVGKIQIKICVFNKLSRIHLDIWIFTKRCLVKREWSSH